MRVVHMSSHHNGNMDVHGASFKTPLSIKPHSHSFKERRPQGKANLGHHRFTTIADWNMLPNEIARAPTLNAFKNGIDTFFDGDPSVFNPEL